MDRALWDKLKELRERSGSGLSDCQRALRDAQGDLDDALDLIPFYPHPNFTRILFRAQVHAMVSADARSAALVELAAPSRPRDHQEALAPFVCGVLAAAGRAPLGADLEAEALGDTTVGAVAAELSAKIGLSVGVLRWTRLEIAPGEHGRCAAQVWAYRRDLGAIVAVTAPSETVAAHPAADRFARELAERIVRWQPAALHVLPDRLWGWEAREGTIEDQRRAASAEAGGALHIARFVWFDRGDGMADASS